MVKWLDNPIIMTALFVIGTLLIGKAFRWIIKKANEHS